MIPTPEEVEAARQAWKRAEEACEVAEKAVSQARRKKKAALTHYDDLCRIVEGEGVIEYPS